MGVVFCFIIWVKTMADIEYIYAAGLSPKEEASMHRYKEDFETFLSIYPVGAAS